MRHRGRVADQGFHATEALAQGEKAAIGCEGSDFLGGAVDFDRDHPAEPGHLALGYVVTGMIYETRIINAADERVAVEGLGDGARVFFVAQHAQLQGFQTAHGEPAVKRRWHGAGGVLQELDGLKHGRVFCQRDALHGVGMSGQIFRDAVDDDVCPKLERLLEARRRERIIDHDECAARVRELGDRRNIRDQEARVRGRFDPDEARIGRKRGLDGLQVGRVNLLRDYAEILVDLVENTVGAAVDVERNDDFITLTQIRLQDSVFRGEPGGKRSNILLTPLSRFFVLVSALSESVSLDELRQINFSDLASKRSITRVPSL